MRLDPKTLLQGWRDEIAAELAGAQKEIPALVTAHEAAIAEAQEIAVSYRDLQQLLAKLHVQNVFGITSQPESPLKLRSEAHRAEVEQAKTKKARAFHDLEAALRKITELERALAQIDHLVPPAEETEAV